MNANTAIAQIGHNRPPPFDLEILQTLEKRVNEFIVVAGEWRDLGEITTEDQAGDLNDFLAGLKKNKADVDSARKAAKKPHDEASKAVQTAFSPLMQRIDLTVGKLTPMLSAWLKRKDEERKAAEAKAREEAAAAAKAAQEAAAKAAARNDIAGEVEAQEAAKAAEERAKEADRLARAKVNVASGSGGGRTVSYRTTWRARVTNLRVAFMHFADDPEVEALLVQLAERKARAKGFDPEVDKIPGFDLTPEKKAV